MTIIVFLVDDSPSMNQVSYMGTTLIDFARQIVESFIKQRQRDQAASTDRYMLMTFEDYPNNVKCGWKEGQRIFTDQLKNLKAKGRSNLKFEAALGSALRFLNTNRMQFVEAREYYGYGRFPSLSEYAVVVSIVDGSSLPLKADQKEVVIPKPKLIGNELTTEAFRWDQRHFSIVLRLPGMPQSGDSNFKNYSFIPPPDESIADLLSNQMGGRSFSLQFHRSLGPCIETILQRIQLNGVMVQLTQLGQDPPLPQNKDGQIGYELPTPINDDPSWKNVVTLLKCRPANASRWPIPEAFWPESLRNSLPPRKAHPQIYFKCTEIEPIASRQFLLYDNYELDRSPLSQYILARRGAVCWPVFVAPSGKPSATNAVDEYPFGYIKTSSSMQSVGLIVTAYNFPALLPLLDEIAKDKSVLATTGFRQRFEKYMKTVPFYYYAELKKMFAKHQIQIQALDEACTKQKPYRAIDLSGLVARIKHFGQREFETSLTEVVKNIQADALNAAKPAKNVVVKVSRARTALGRTGQTPLGECRRQPALNPLRQEIPDIYKDLPVYALCEAEPKQVKPSEQFKNPFEIQRENLVTQLLKMRINFDQQLQLNAPHCFQGGIPGQKIKLQQAEDLSSQPIQRMGAYEDYMKRLQEIGLGPMRPIDDQEKPKAHAFGNPFKLDKKNMSIVDEVGEMNVSSTNGVGGEEKRRLKAAASSSSSSSNGGATKPGGGGLKAPPRRKPGPIDPHRAFAWRHRCRSSRASGASESDVSDTESIYSGVSDISDLSDDGQTKQFEAKGSRFSPIRKRQFSVEEVDDDDDQDGEGAGRSHSQEDNVDEAEYRSSEDDNEESAFSVLLIDPDSEEGALLQGAHFSPPKSTSGGPSTSFTTTTPSSSSSSTVQPSSSSVVVVASSSSTALESASVSEQTGRKRKKPKASTTTANTTTTTNATAPLNGLANNNNREDGGGGIPSSSSLSFSKHPQDPTALPPSLSLFSGGGSGRSADDIPPPTKTKRREKDQQQQQLKKTNAAEEDEGKLRRRLEEHRSAAENPPEEGDGDSVPVDPVPDYLVGMSAKRPKLAMATSSVERPSVKAKKKQPSLSTTTESTTTMATTTNGSAPPSSPILRIEFPSVAEEEARCQSASLRTRPQPSPQHLQAMRDIQKTIRQFTTSARIFNQCAHLIADSPLAIRRALHTLAVREAQRFRRTELIDRLQKLLTVETSGNTNDD